jgi:hypothetical protein
MANNYLTNNTEVVVMANKLYKVKEGDAAPNGGDGIE